MALCRYCNNQSFQPMIYETIHTPLSSYYRSVIFSILLLFNKPLISILELPICCHFSQPPYQIANTRPSISSRLLYVGPDMVLILVYKYITAGPYRSSRMWPWYKSIIAISLTYLFTPHLSAYVITSKTTNLLPYINKKPLN